MLELHCCHSHCWTFFLTWTEDRDTRHHLGQMENHPESNVFLQQMSPCRLMLHGAWHLLVSLFCWQLPPGRRLYLHADLFQSELHFFLERFYQCTPCPLSRDTGHGRKALLGQSHFLYLGFLITNVQHNNVLTYCLYLQDLSHNLPFIT